MTDERAVPEGKKVVGSATTGPDGDPKPKTRDLSVLKHPLLIIVMSLVVTAFLITPIARHWQDRQNELELKRDLIEQIATTSTTSVRQGIALVKGDMQSAGADKDSSPAETYLLVRNAWLINRSSARSAIVTYFPRLESCWYSYERAVADYLGLVDRDPRVRKTRVEALQGYVNSNMAEVYDGPPVADGCDAITDLPTRVQDRYKKLVNVMANKRYWEALEAESTAVKVGGLDDHTKRSGFRAAYDALGEAMLIGKDRINKSIVSSESEAFDTGWLDN